MRSHRRRREAALPRHRLEARARTACPAKVTAIEYDPNRNARLALLQYADGEKRYVLAPLGVEVGLEVRNGPEAEAKPGNCLPLRNIPVGPHDPRRRAEARPRRADRPQRGRRRHPHGPRGRVRAPHAAVHRDAPRPPRLPRHGRPGRQRRREPRGARHRGPQASPGAPPEVRGSAQNPVSHPMGGGEGRRAGGRHPVSKWGLLTKGGNTRRPRKKSAIASSCVAASAARRSGGSPWAAASRRAPTSIRTLGPRRADGEQPPRAHQDVVAPLRHRPRVRRATRSWSTTATSS